MYVCIADPRTLVESKMLKLVGGWSCADCLYSSKYTTDVRRHIESKHMQDYNGCAVCNLVFDHFNQYKQHYQMCHAK